MRGISERMVHPAGLGRVFRTVLLVLGWCTIASALLLTGRSELLVVLAFLSIVPFVFWRVHQRGQPIDPFAPEIAFPLLFVTFLFVGTIDLGFDIGFQLVIPWTQWLYYILGLMAYLAGVAILKSGMTVHNKYRAQAGGWNRGRFILCMLVLTTIAALSRLLILQKTGIPLLAPENQESRVLYSRGISGSLAMSFEAVFLCSLLFLLVEPAPRSQKLLVGVLCAVAMVDALSAGSRAGMLRLLIAGLVLFHYGHHRIRLRTLLAAGVIAVVIASLIGTYRAVALWGPAHIERLEANGFGSSVLWAANGYEIFRLPTEGFYLLRQQVPQWHPYEYGAESFAAVATFLPGHQPSPAEKVQTILKLDFVGYGAATTLLGPLYVDGGIVGIVLGMFLFGFLAKWLYLKALGSNNVLWLLTYAWFVQNQFKAVKDEILPDVGVLWIVLLLAVVHLISTSRRRDIREPLQPANAAGSGSNV